MLHHIHAIIQKLINKDRVVVDILLTDLSKVVLEDLNHFQEELKDHASINILLGDGWLPGMNDVNSEGIHLPLVVVVGEEAPIFSLFCSAWPILCSIQRTA